MSKLPALSSQRPCVYLTDKDNAITDSLWVAEAFGKRHGNVLRDIQALHTAGQAVDLLTVTAELRKAGQLDRAGGAHGVSQLMLRVNGAANLSSHCLVLLELYTKRRIADVAHALLRRAYDPMGDPHELLGEAQTGLNSLHDSLQVRRVRSLGEMFHSAVDEVVAATRAPAGLTGVPSGLSALDAITGGWQPSDLIIIAARPGMGKTSVTLAMACMAEAAARSRGAGSIFFSLEMGAVQLAKKAIASQSGKTTSQLTRGVGMKPEEAEHLRVSAGALAGSKLLIDDTPALSIGELRAKAAKAKAEHNIEIIYIDYLQLMRGDQKGNREQEIGSISRGLKLIAKELNVPVIALSQLSRAVESRGGDKKPQLSDLRESGSIEQDADLVIFPHRPEYYGIEHDENGNPTAGLTELIIAKHRNGSTGSPIVRSDMATGRYEDLEADKPYEVQASRYEPSRLPESQFDQKPPF